MSRYPSFFGSSNTTSTITTPINRSTILSIDRINELIIENNERAVLEALSSDTISINQTMDRDPYRNTLLHTAIIMGNVKIIQRLIDMGADLRLKNRKGESCAEMLSKSHLGDVIQYLSDKSSTKIQELTREVKEKTTRIQNLEDNLVKLENQNNKITKENQVLETEVVQLRKRKVELEETNTALRQATKKQKN